jgi:penicillin-binding protein 1A
MSFSLKNWRGLTPERKSKAIWLITLACAYQLVLFTLLIEVNYLGYFGKMPDWKDLENPKHELASEVYSADGVLLGKYYRENRSPVKYTQISPNVLNALTVTEDVRFYDHSGIDFKGFFAIFYYLVKGDQRGSSTITQQLAKNLYKTRGSSFKGWLGYIPGVSTVLAKAKEWKLAIKLERAYTKNEILTLYLNTVDFGSNSFGIKVAAKTFFSTAPDSLTVPQAAMLVGMLRAPTLYSPIINPKNCIERRNVVLDLMRENDLITQVDYDNYTQEKLGLIYTVENHTQGIATYFRGELSKFLQEWCKKTGRDLYGDGLKVYTTIDSRIQMHAEAAMEEHMKTLQKRFFKHWDGHNPWVDAEKNEIPNFIANAAKKSERYRLLKLKYEDQNDSIQYYLNKPVKMKVFSWDGEIDTTLSPLDSIAYYKHFLHTGFLTMDPNSGEIKSWVGGINYKHFKYDHVKQSVRQPGSAFKPFVYTAAIANGYSPCYLVQDSPITFEYDEEGKHIVWTPKNADRVYTYDSLTMRRGMARSINTIAAKVMQLVGIDEVAKYAQRCGIESPLHKIPSLCLGSSDVSVFEMTGAYCTFVNKGIWIEPHFVARIEDHNGNVLQEFIPKTRDAISEDVAYAMVHMLRGGTEEGGGTSQALFQWNVFRNNEVGGKTGTTSNYSDGWFMCITKGLVGGIWVGGDDRSIHFRTSQTGEGSKTALPMFGIFLENVYADTSINVERGYFKKPKKLSINLNCPRRAERVVVDSLALMEQAEEGEFVEEEVVVE